MPWTWRKSSDGFTLRHPTGSSSHARQRRRPTQQERTVLEALGRCGSIRAGRWATAREVEYLMLRHMDADVIPTASYISIRVLNPLWRRGWVEKLGGKWTHSIRDPAPLPKDFDLNFYRLAEASFVDLGIPRSAPFRPGGDVEYPLRETEGGSEKSSQTAR